MAEDTSDSQFAKPSFIIGAILILAVIAGLVWLVLTRSGSDETAQSSQPPATTTVSAQSAQSGASSGKQAGSSKCDLPAGDQTVPSTAILSTPVSVGNDLLVPSVANIGPGRTDGVSQCFAQSPTGAVLAAANWVTWFSSQQELPTVVDQLMLDDDNGKRLLASVKQGWSGQSMSPVSIQGYRYEDRGADNALVVLALTRVADPDTLVAWPIVVKWDGNDWRVLAPAADSWGERAITSLQTEGFIEWGAI